MHILIAPNAFKGSLSAEKAASCIQEGLRRSGLLCQTTLCPVGDGGDDTVTLLTPKMGGEMVSMAVHDPLGRIITAEYGWVAQDKKALIGVSSASGLRLLKKAELDPLRTTSYGTGELIDAALSRGARQLMIAVGGSATVDGATGLLKALGLRFMDSQDTDIPIHRLPMDLSALAAVDTTGLNKRLQDCAVTVLCDVKNKLLGKEGAVTVYGPQKGAGPGDLVLLESGLQRWNEITFQSTGVDMASLVSGGAAGGIAAGLAAYTGAKLVDGIDFFLDTVQFDQLLQQVDLVITAEGSIDAQTLSGKGPFGVARRAKERGIAVTGLAGHIPAFPGEKISRYFDRLLSINPPRESLQTAMENTAANLTETACRLGKILAV